jgi:hypothetical protein
MYLKEKKPDMTKLEPKFYLNLISSMLFNKKS